MDRQTQELVAQMSSSKGRFMGDLDASIEVYMAKGFDRKQAIGIAFSRISNRYQLLLLCLFY